MSKYLIVCAILSCILDCKQSEVSRETIIRMDLKKMHQIDMHGEYARQICLTNDGTSVLIDEVKKVLLAGDQYIVQCKNKVLGFDVQTGTQKMSFSGQWGENRTFLHLWDTWVEGKTICMYDVKDKKVFRCDLNGKNSDVTFVTNKGEDNPFQVLIKTVEGNYVGKRAYGGMEDCELNLYDKNFEFVKEIGDLKIKSGIYIGYPFFMYRPSEILYYRYFYNNIYAIDDKQNVSVKYNIDFGENYMPFDLSWRDEYDCIDFINSSEEDYAILVSNIYESDKYFCFRFLWKKKKCLGVYDKSNGKTASFMFDSSPSDSVVDVYAFDDKVLLVNQDGDKTCLTTISVDDLLKND